MNEAYTDKSEPLLTRSRTYLMILQQNENFSGKHGENRTIELFTQGVVPNVAGGLEYFAKAERNMKQLIA